MSATWTGTGVLWVWQIPNIDFQGEVLWILQKSCLLGYFLALIKCLKSTTRFCIQCTILLSPYICFKLTQDQLPSVGLLGPEENSFVLARSHLSSAVLVEDQLSPSEGIAPLPTLIANPFTWDFLCANSKNPRKTCQWFEELSRRSFIWSHLHIYNYLQRNLLPSRFWLICIFPEGIVAKLVSQLLTCST